MGTWTPGPAATTGPDVFTGDETSETASGLNGDDTLNGGGGDDVLNGGEHSDRLIGGAGADLLDGGANAFGFDVADYFDSPAGVTINLTTGTISGGHAQGDTLVAIEGLAGSNFGDALTGDSGANRLAGSEGDDWLEGLAGDDALAGGRGDDLLFGGDGDDTLGNGDARVDGLSFAYDFQPHPTGADTMDGGAGVDRAILVYADRTANIAFTLGAGGAASTVLVGGVAEGAVVNVERIGFGGGSGDDDIAGGALEDGLSGGAGNDALRGGAGSDGVFGDDGDDTLSGDAGDDEIHGGPGADTVNGGDGDDFVVGDVLADPVAGGDDVLIGGGGHDFLAGGGGADTLSGGDDHDSLVGEEGDDHLIGGEGGDNLTGGEGDDRVEGGEGDDIVDDREVNFQPDSDIYLGGDGDDRFTFLGTNASPFDFDRIFGGSEEADSGADTVDYSQARGANGLIVQLGAGYATLGGELITLLSGIENVVGTNNELVGDTLIGSDANNVISAGSGSDWLVGRGGDDTFEIGDESGHVDHIFGDEGTDTLDLFDASFVGAVAGVIVQLSGYATTSSGELIAFISSIENAVGTLFDDALIGTAADNRITGGQGSDWLVGQGGDDWFVQGTFDGVDRLFGDAGVDTIDYSAATTGANIQLNGWSTLAGGATLATFTGIENAVGSTFNDAIIGSGLDNRVTGGTGSDWLVGGAGDDTFVQTIDTSGIDRIFGGAAGADAGTADTIDYSTASQGVIVQLSGYATINGGGNITLATFAGIENAMGSNFADALIGNAADNRLTGGGGGDWLVGGAGADTFVYQTITDGAGDSIRDFAQGADHVDLSALDAVPGGADDAFTFATVRHAGVLGEAVVANFDASSVVSLYLDADNFADMTIQVVHAQGVVLSMEDFVL